MTTHEMRLVPTPFRCPEMTRARQRGRQATWASIAALFTFLGKVLAIALVTVFALPAAALMVAAAVVQAGPWFTLCVFVTAGLLVLAVWALWTERQRLLARLDRFVSTSDSPVRAGVQRTGETLGGEA